MFAPTRTLYFLFLLVSGLVLAQSSTSLSSTAPSAVPGQNNSTRPDGERITVASAALNLAVGTLRDRDGTLSLPGGDFAPAHTPILYSQLAEFDINIQNTTYKDLVQTQLPRAVTAGRALSREVLDHLSYGYAAVKAYVAYQDTSFLKTAEEIWNFGNTFCVSEADVKARKIATKSLPLQSDCNGQSFVGGVFETLNSTIKNEIDEILDASASGAFMILSALLAEQTSNSTYLKAANTTLQFLRTFMYFPEGNVNSHEHSIVALQDDGHSRSVPCDQGDQPVWYPVTGNIIEGLSILASITGDAATLTLLHDTIVSATQNREQQRPDHVIDIGALGPEEFTTGDPFLVRGLTTAIKRNHVQGIEDDVKNFLEIQYNALLANATIPGTNIYGASWIGPPSRKLDPVFQTYAALVLVQGITVANSTSDTGIDKNGATTTSSAVSGTTTPTATPSAKKNNSAKTGAIAGGVVGGVAVIAALSCLICLFLRRRKRKQLEAFSTSSFEEPYTRETEVAYTESSPWPNGIDVESRLNPLRAREEPSLSSVGDVDLPKVSTPRPESVGEDPHLRSIPTAELARILNARLQTETWRGSAPPSYHPRSQSRSS